MCKSDGGTSCVSTGTWRGGWIVFLDNDGSASWTTGDVLLRTTEGLDANSFTFTTTPASDLVVFNLRGEAQSGGGVD